MSNAVSLNKVERAGSATMTVAVYRVEFSLTDAQGTMGFLSVADAAAPRSYMTGTMAVEIPVSQASESEVFAKAREVLHAALTRLAEEVKPQAPK